MIEPEGDSVFILRYVFHTVAQHVVFALPIGILRKLILRHVRLDTVIFKCNIVAGSDFVHGLHIGQLLCHIRIGQLLDIHGKFSGSGVLAIVQIYADRKYDSARAGRIANMEIRPSAVRIHIQRIIKAAFGHRGGVFAVIANACFPARHVLPAVSGFFEIQGRRVGFYIFAIADIQEGFILFGGDRRIGAADGHGDFLDIIDAVYARIGIQNVASGFIKRKAHAFIIRLADDIFRSGEIITVHLRAVRKLSIRKLNVRKLQLQCFAGLHRIAILGNRNFGGKICIHLRFDFKGNRRFINIAGIGNIALRVRNADFCVHGYTRSARSALIVFDVKTDLAIQVFRRNVAHNAIVQRRRIRHLNFFGARAVRAGAARPVLRGNRAEIYLGHIQKHGRIQRGNRLVHRQFRHGGVARVNIMINRILRGGSVRRTYDGRKIRSRKRIVRNIYDRIGNFDGLQMVVIRKRPRADVLRTVRHDHRFDRGIAREGFRIDGFDRRRQAHGKPFRSAARAQKLHEQHNGQQQRHPSVLYTIFSHRINPPSHNWNSYGSVL